MFLKKLRDNNGNITTKEGSGRPITIRTQENINRIRRLVGSPDDRPQTSVNIRKTSLETGISRSTVHRIVKKDLDMEIFKRVYVQKLTESSINLRLIRSRRLLNRFHTNANVNKIWFTDEKLFTLRPPKNN